MEGQDRQDRGAGALTTSPCPAIETDALIIGAGPVGLFQAFQLGLLEVHCHIVDALPRVGGQCAQLYGDKPIYDIPGLPRTTGNALAQSLLEQVAPFAPTLHLGEQISTLSRAEDGRWHAETASRNLCFLAKTIFIAAGVGAFVPRRLALPDAHRFEGTRLFYHPESLERFAGQAVVVLGGDDAALQAAIDLGGLARTVTLVHRRDVLQAEAGLEAAFRAQVADGPLRLVIGQIVGMDEEGFDLCAPSGDTQRLQADALLAYPGISPRLGPIADWGLDLVRKQVPVSTDTFATREPGIFAVGDINTYPGKKKLIVCGFHEATLAAWGAMEHIFPGRAIALQYTTTSTRLQALLNTQKPRP